ncbi:MAG: hypothetical protein PHQ89_00540 [Bacilli bacterium]|nr:hypothetical protein [Bacilli bacterium]
MFNNINQEEYEAIVRDAHMTFKKEVQKSHSVTEKLYFFCLERKRTGEAFDRHADDYQTKEQQAIFKLNLFINNNYQFTKELIAYSTIYLKTNNLEIIIKSFSRRKLLQKDIWNDIFTKIGKNHQLPVRYIELKAAEIFSFKNTYLDLENNAIKAEPQDKILAILKGISNSRAVAKKIEQPIIKKNIYQKSLYK